MLDAYHYIMNHILNPGRLFLGKMYTSLPLESNRKMDQALDTFNEQLMHLIQQCKEEKSGHTTFEEKEQSLLQMMVNSVDEEGSGLTNSELKDNCAVFFLAGHETTASALSSLFYSLAKNPHVQDKLYEEICSTFSNDETSVINYQKLHDMPYLECVLKENLRLYPPIALLPGRMLQSSQVIDGYKVPKGFVVSLNIFSLHRNPQVWGEDAEEFRPERFMENIYPPFALAPFGGGPRLCIGKQFSLTEQKAFAVTLLKRFKIELLHPGQVMHFNKNTPSLAPVEDFKLKLVRRFDY
ncbi:hypothetical protein C9374_008206 [Naegleria lovaniensis]|uniref:Cytochrome P450 n=1 Tax=Naegleria lovaniensis TaxID=51637 RepID=A0AA88KFR7_NAELO|nr:uncharacterized protein C9374_008206 [Naegleria lovaniensis]KAG2378567.1 hypothetical protein C9374_008206 [Naegleria lovaniensis]